MRSRLKSVRNKLALKFLGLDNSLVVNAFEFQKISKLFHSLSSYYPYTSSALDPASLSLVINDVVINSRKSILELGSGISTILLAHVLKTNRIEASFNSIEENAEWANYIMGCLRREGLDTFCTVHAVPVKTMPDNQQWYDHKAMEKLKKEMGSIDCLLIDGPIAHSQGKQLIRQGAEYLFDFLAENYSIFLDDTNRTGERGIRSQWAKNHGWTFNESHSISYYIKGKHFNIS